MGLPKITLPEYEHFLVGLNRKVKYRPFTNNEQKILLLAKENGSKESIILAVKQIISNCIVSKDVDVDAMPVFDVEDLFLRIRSKSVSEIVTAKYSLDYDDNGVKKTAFASVDINLDEVKVKTSPEHKKLIDISESHKLSMKYPTFDMIEQIKSDEELTKKCIDCIIHEDEVYVLSDYSDEEIQEFLDSIDTKGLLAIKKFFDTMPCLEHDIELDFKIKKSTKTLRGLNDFFT